MKRIKNLFIMTTIFVLSLVVNVNADTMAGYYLKIGDEDNNDVFSPGEIVKLYAHSGYYDNDGEFAAESKISFDSNIFELVGKKIEFAHNDSTFMVYDDGSTDLTRCVESKDPTYSYENGLLITKINGHRKSTCEEDNYVPNITTIIELKVKNVPDQKTNIKYIDQNFDFNIYIKKDKGNSNADVKKIYVDGEEIKSIADSTSASSYIYHYMYNLNTEGKSKVTIQAEAEDSSAIVSGNGEVSLKEGLNEYVVTVKAKDGLEKDYFVNIYASDVPEESQNEQVEPEKIDNPITMYLFYGEGCPHCADLEKFLDSIDDEYGKYYNLVKYEVWYSKSNNRLFEKVVDRMHTDSEKIGVPYLVIGDDYIMGYGNTEEENRQIINDIMRVYNSSTRYDVIKDETINTEDEKNEVVEETKDDQVAELKKLKTYLEIISGCCILVIVLFVGFIIVNNRKKNEEEKSE